MGRLVSDCHKAVMVVRGDSFGEGTNHYECTECGQACNFIDTEASDSDTEGAKSSESTTLRKLAQAAPKTKDNK